MTYDKSLSTLPGAEKVDIVHQFGIIKVTGSLEQWYEQYNQSEPKDLQDERDPEWMQDVENDTLDTSAIEFEISRQRLAVQISPDDNCLKCQDFIETISRYVYSPVNSTPDVGQITKFHYSDFPEWEASRRAGCRLCNLIMQPGVERYYGNLINYQKFQYRLSQLGQKLAHSLTFRGRPCSIIPFGFTVGNHVYSNHILEEFLVAEKAVGNLSLSTGNNTSSPMLTHSAQTTSSVAIELAKRWLSTCRATHSSCGQEASRHQTPTRLLALEGSTVKLIQSADLGTGDHCYATLSHCWGNLDFLRLTEATRKAFEISIPVETLTKTFQDAISITRRLGLRYLWIDSLCIIQDSLEDWEKEASLMCDVYGNSAINLAAASSQNGRRGCQFAAPGFPQAVYVERPETTVGVAPNLLIRKRLQFSTFVDRSHLSSRAWALQERLLAPRTIFFTPLGLFWECNTKYASEAWPEGLASHEQSAKRKPHSEVWYDDITRLYSAANLTFPSDKLIALAGIAREAQKQNGDQYLAGMWRNNLIYQLCWSRNSVSTNKPFASSRYSSYIAPSWSWASVDCEMAPMISSTSSARPLARILDAWTTTCGDDPLGQISGGAVKIACSALILPDPVDWHLEERDADGVSYSGWDKSAGIVFDSDDKVVGPIYLLPLVEQQQEQISGIAIERFLGLEEEFRRVGYFYKWQNSWARVSQSTTEEAGRDTAASICEDESYDPEYPEQRYVITIV